MHIDHIRGLDGPLTIDHPRKSFSIHAIRARIPKQVRSLRENLIREFCRFTTEAQVDGLLVSGIFRLRNYIDHLITSCSRRYRERLPLDTIHNHFGTVTDPTRITCDSRCISTISFTPLVDRGQLHTKGMLSFHFHRLSNLRRVDNNSCTD